MKFFVSIKLIEFPKISSPIKTSQTYKFCMSLIINLPCIVSQNCSMSLIFVQTIKFFAYFLFHVKTA